tara:strand:+ start:76 stop:525 length:450 start_codon:yes stop_codon:yes gene_type:complete
MRIDIDYLARILDLFLEADTAHIEIPDFPKLGMKIEDESNPGGLDEEFLFHLQLAIENELISNKDMYVDGLKSVGIRIGGGGSISLTSVPIRLTQNGHDFANALHNKEVLSKLKSELKDAPFKTIFDGSQKLLEHFFKKKLDNLISEGA